MISYRFAAGCIAVVLLLAGFSFFAQPYSSRMAVAPAAAPPPGDTVHIIHSNKTTMQKSNDSTNLFILEGNVILKQGKTIFKCDRCIKNDRENTFEAWGNVHINDSDTTNIYAEHLKYFSLKQKAYLDKNVRLTDGRVVLTTPSLDYDMVNHIATYNNGGKVVNKKTVITSKEAFYYTDLKDVFFKKNVWVKDPAYNITADSLRYNTDDQIARFISKTTIKDSANRTIRTKDGFYNLKSGEAQFAQRSDMDDGKTSLIADSIALDNDLAQAKGNAIIVDTARGTTIIANLIYQKRSNEAVLATQKPLMIIKQDSDSIYVTADTLFSAKLTDLFVTAPLPALDSSVTKTDSLKLKAVKKKVADNDSTNRYFEAYRNVKVFSDSMQAISDSLFYSFKDSVFRLYQNPVVWGKENQISGDTLLLYTQNRKPSRFDAFNNGFIVNQLQPQVFNQIKASSLRGFFTHGELDSIRAKGSAQCIYYLQDDDSAYTGINQSNSDIIDAYLKNKGLDKIVFRSQVEGTIYPIRQKSPTEMLLPNFKWWEDKRPKTKYDIMQ